MPGPRNRRTKNHNHNNKRVLAEKSRSKPSTRTNINKLNTSSGEKTLNAPGDKHTDNTDNTQRILELKTQKQQYRQKIRSLENELITVRQTQKIREMFSKGFGLNQSGMPPVIPTGPQIVQQASGNSVTVSADEGMVVSPGPSTQAPKINPPPFRMKMTPAYVLERIRRKNMSEMHPFKRMDINNGKNRFPAGSRT